MFVPPERGEQTRWRPGTGFPGVPRGAMAAAGGAGRETRAKRVPPVQDFCTTLIMKKIGTVKVVVVQFIYFLLR